uniref:Uncharacterized protein n=1 Tax=Trichuris muris TaxID=70415 RepID=A0A5S6QGG0_TRIMR
MSAEMGTGYSPKRSRRLRYTLPMHRKQLLFSPVCWGFRQLAYPIRRYSSMTSAYLLAKSELRRNRLSKPAKRALAISLRIHIDTVYSSGGRLYDFHGAFVLRTQLLFMRLPYARRFDRPLALNERCKLFTLMIQRNAAHSPRAWRLHRRTRIARKATDNASADRCLHRSRCIDARWWLYYAELLVCSYDVHACQYRDVIVLYLDEINPLQVWPVISKAFEDNSSLSQIQCRDG